MVATWPSTRGVLSRTGKAFQARVLAQRGPPEGPALPDPLRTLPEADALQVHPGPWTVRALVTGVELPRAS